MRKIEDEEGKAGSEGKRKENEKKRAVTVIVDEKILS